MKILAVKGQINTFVGVGDAGKASHAIVVAHMKVAKSGDQATGESSFLDNNNSVSYPMI